MGSLWVLHKDRHFRHLLTSYMTMSSCKKPLITTGTIAFYKRHVDHTIVLAKPCDLDKILKQVNSFHPQIQFTIEQFSDNDIHFLDIQILPNGTTVYRKQTHTGQYQHFSS